MNKEHIEELNIAITKLLATVGKGTENISLISSKDNLGHYKLRDPEVIKKTLRGPKPGPAAKLRRANASWIHRNKYLTSLGYLPVSFINELLSFGKTGEILLESVITTLLEYVVAAYRRRNLEFFTVMAPVLSRDGPVGHIT